MTENFHNRPSEIAGKATNKTMTSRHPDDIIHLILIRTDLLTLLKCNLVCRQFSRILSNPYFWECKLKTREDHERVILELIGSPDRKRITQLALAPHLIKLSNDKCYFPGVVAWKQNELDFATSLGLVSMWFDNISDQPFLHFCSLCNDFRFLVKSGQSICQGHERGVSYPEFRQAIPGYIIMQPPNYRFPYD